MEIESSRDPGFQSLQRAVRVVMKKVEDRYPGKVDFVRAAIGVEDRDAQATLLEAAGLMAGWSTPQETEAYVIKNSVTVFGQKLVPRGSSPQAMQSAGERHLRDLMRTVETFLESEPPPKSGH